MSKTYYAINSRREVSPEVAKRQRMEYSVISAFVKTALKAGHTLGVHNGEELVVKHSSSYKAIMGAIMSVDEECIFVYPVGATSGPRIGWVYLVYGNDGFDVICDYSSNLGESDPDDTTCLNLMAKAHEVADRLADRVC